MENITSFFFNIIPPAILLFLLTILGVDIPMSNEYPESIYLLLILILLIFLGFLGQALSKIIKEKVLYEIVWQEVIKEDKEHNYKLAEKYLKKMLPEHETYEEKVKRIFFTMDNYTSLNPGRLLPHFASRLAYWFNLYWVSIITLGTSVAMIMDSGITTEKYIVLISAIILFMVATYETSVHLKNHYDILLKTFVSLVAIDKNKTREK